MNLFNILRNFYQRLKARDAQIDRFKTKLKLAKAENRNLLKEMGRLAKRIDEQPEFPNIKFEPWGRIDQTTVDWCKDAIVKTGLAYILVQGNISEIRIGPDEKTDRLTGVAAVATVVGGTVYLDDIGWMPGWDLPGTILHEAVHAWQIREGLTGNTANMERTAYMVQQLLEWRWC